jgi:glutathione S-transferase
MGGEMKLRYSSTSPFVRKVLVFAHEVGLAQAIECVTTDVWSADTDLYEDNPLGKVPTLVTPDGTFIGSTLCCEYLDSLHAGARLIPSEMPARWRVLQRHSLADGVMEATVAHAMESLRRPRGLVYPAALERQQQKIARGLDRIDALLDGFGTGIDLATITLGCALGYLDLRLPELDWRHAHPRLAAWFARFDQRASMRATQPSLRSVGS